MSSAFVICRGKNFIYWANGNIGCDSKRRKMKYPIYEHGKFANQGKANEPPDCVLEYLSASGHWLTSREWGNLTVEQGRNVARSCPGYRLRIRQPDGLFRLDGDVEDPEYEVEKKEANKNLKPRCPQCKCQLQNNTSSIVQHFQEKHNRVISEGEANQIATHALGSTVPYTERDDQGRTPFEVNGGAMFRNRLKF